MSSSNINANTPPVSFPSTYDFDVTTMGTQMDPAALALEKSKIEDYLNHYYEINNNNDYDHDSDEDSEIDYDSLGSNHLLVQNRDWMQRVRLQKGFVGRSVEEIQTPGASNSSSINTNSDHEVSTPDPTTHTTTPS